MRFGIRELGASPQPFVWSSPAGLTPAVGKVPGGFALVTSGAVLDAAASNKRALFFVDTGSNPWTVQGSLSL